MVKIGIIGDFNPQNATHVFTDDGLRHAAKLLGFVLELTWLPTDQSFDYSAFNGLFCSPGSPYCSLEGALKGIRYARENGVAFMGTCGGFQHLILEYARNVMGFKDATHAESDPYASCLFITPLSCSLVGKTMEVTLMPDSQAARAFASEQTRERFYCNFGLNPQYQSDLVKAGLVISGTDAGGEARIAELPLHPFFLGTLFVPQARSTAANPHPLLVAFCRAAMEASRMPSVLQTWAPVAAETKG